MSGQLTSVWRLDNLLQGFARQAPLPDLEVRGLCMDSRQIQPGDLFLACQGGGDRHGLDFLGQVASAGAAAIAYEPTRGVPESFELPLVPVENLSARAGELADRFFHSPSVDMSVVAITGTNGKTSVSHYIAQALHELYERCGLLGTLGYGVYGRLKKASHTTPDVVRVHGLMAEFRAAGCEYAVMEVSSHALDQGRVNAMRFAVAVLTNLSRDHLDYHGDMESYAAAKRRLFDWLDLRAAVLNADDAVARQWLKSLPQKLNVLAYSMQEQDPGVQAICAREVDYSLSGIRMAIRTPFGDAVLNAPVLGRFNAENLLAALGVLLQLGVSLEVAVRSLESVVPVAGRMQRINDPDGRLVVVDYAHTPDALQQVVNAVRAHTSGKLICVFGCGGDRDVGKRPEMGAIVERDADVVIVTDDNPRSENPEAITDQILAGMRTPEESQVIHDRRVAIETALSMAVAGDAVLIAGKGHETVQIVGEQSLPFDDAAVATDWLEQAS